MSIHLKGISDRTYFGTFSLGLTPDGVAHLDVVALPHVDPVFVYAVLRPTLRLPFLSRENRSGSSFPRWIHHGLRGEVYYFLQNGINSTFEIV